MADDSYDVALQSAKSYTEGLVDQKPKAYEQKECSQDELTRHIESKRYRMVGAVNHPAVASTRFSGTNCNNAHRNQDGAKYHC
jgi:hypothetical protein